MITTRSKRKTIITRFEITKLERFRSFEIRLPANVKRITGVLVTASATWAAGTVILQSNNQSDIFHIAQVQEAGVELSDESLQSIEDSQFDSEKAWVTGKVPKMRSVNVEGDTTIINAWFKSNSFDKSFMVTVYVECELAEELEEVTSIQLEEKIGSRKNKRIDPLEPMEIHL